MTTAPFDEPTERPDLPPGWRIPEGEPPLPARAPHGTLRILHPERRLIGAIWLLLLTPFAALAGIGTYESWVEGNWKIATLTGALGLGAVVLDYFGLRAAINRTELRIARGRIHLETRPLSFPEDDVDYSVEGVRELELVRQGRRYQVVAHLHAAPSQVLLDGIRGETAARYLGWVVAHHLGASSPERAAAQGR